jgi:hypothetical protein
VLGAMICLAQQTTDSAADNSERLRITLVGLRGAVSDPRVPAESSKSATKALDWLQPELLGETRWTKGTGIRQGIGGIGVLGGPHPKPEPVPVQYLDSLNGDLKTIQAALPIEDDKKRAEVIAYTVKDIGLKSEDCRKFGRGRLIPVDVYTKEAGRTVNSWQVYYKNIPFGDLETEWLPMDTLSSPARTSLSPGLYEFHAEMNINGMVLRSPVVRRPVAMEETVSFELPVP